MQSNLYIPKTICVGFQKRSDTFTGKLGFVVYRDDKNVLRQEKSWNGWRDHKIETAEFYNTPRPNYVFNKDIKRSGHWSTHSKVRIYDPRDFEFEIEFSNMMYILMHSDVSKRDIQEECVFAWSGSNLVLLPVNSEEYQNSIAHTKKLEMKFSAKDLQKGFTYSTKKCGDFVYLGHYEWCEKNWNDNWKNTGKKHVFYSPSKYYSEYFHALNTSEICENITNECHAQYAKFVEDLFKTKHMQKMGIFSIKKGFETVGYKKSGHENYKVTLTNKLIEQDYRDFGYDMEATKKAPKIYDFNVDEVEFKIDNNKPRISVKKKSSYSYYDNNSRKKTHYIQLMKEKGVDRSNQDAIQQFFVNAGFGILYFTDVDGKKEIVN